MKKISSFGKWILVLFFFMSSSQAFAVITAGTSNTAVGDGALDPDNSSVSGTSNIAIGVSAASGISSGQDNIAIGDNALTSVDTGGFNAAIGTNALANTDS